MKKIDLIRVFQLSFLGTLLLSISFGMVLRDELGLLPKLYIKIMLAIGLVLIILDIVLYRKKCIELYNSLK